MRESYTCNPAEMTITNSEPRQATMRMDADETMNILKELLLMMDDTNICLFGQAFMPTEEKTPEPDCLSNALKVIQYQARAALIRFGEMRQRMV